MTTEDECCTSYVEHRSEEYEREVPVGNVVLREDDSLVDAAAGSFAGSADAISTLEETGRERLVECKREPTFRGLGQLVLYAYFRRRDRELIRERYERRNGPWQTNDDVQGIHSHVSKEGTGADRTYHPHPSIEELKQVLAVESISPADAPLLSAYLDLGVTVEHRTDGVWRELDGALFESQPEPTTESMTEWLASNAGGDLGSANEADLWDSVADEFDTDSVFMEVPVGSRLYPDTETPLRADVVIPVADQWFIIELKTSSNDEARQDFQRAVGQAVGYASLFAREWELSRDRVVPIVAQDPLALVGHSYRKDRYDDSERMTQAAFGGVTEPLILGDPQVFE